MTGSDTDPRRPPGLPVQDPTRSMGNRVLLVALVVAGLVVGAIAIGAVSNQSDQRAESRDVAAPSVSKYTQTWAQGYSSTTCEQWGGEMSAAQRFAGAADMLTSARNKMDGGEGLPPDSMINEFANGISNVCVVPSMALAEAAVGLYLTEPRFAP